MPTPRYAQVSVPFWVEDEVLPLLKTIELALLLVGIAILMTIGLMLPT